MNQILSTESPKNNKNKRSNNPIDIKKIIVFFSCAIAIFAIIIAGVGIYGIYDRNKKNNITQAEPMVSVEQIDNNIRIKAEYVEGISKLVYYWTEEDKMEEPQEGRTSIEKLIEIPKGVNTLTVELIDMQGKVTPFSKTFESLITAEDSIIEVGLIEDGIKIEIVAENSDGLKYIKYKLNDDEEIKIDSDPSNPNIITITIGIENLDIERGDNTISVVAVDLNDNETVEIKTIKGQNNPVIAVVRNGDNLDCEITHDMGFEKIEFDLNGQIFAYDKNHSRYDETLTTFKTSIPLQNGENKLIINAYSLEGTTETYRGRVTK